MVVTATEALHNPAGWSDLQDRLATPSTNSAHRVVDATHAGVVDDTVTYEPSLVAIAETGPTGDQVLWFRTPGGHDAEWWSNRCSRGGWS